MISRTSPKLRVPFRRVLLVPALALLLLGVPVLAAAQTGTPAATTDVVPVATTTVEAGWSSPPTPVDAQLVGVTWSGDQDAEFQVEVRHDDGSWSKATNVAADGAGQADPSTKDGVRAATVGATASEPVWVGEDAAAVKVTLASGEATNVSVAAVDAPSAPAPSGSAGALGTVIPPLHGAARFVFGGALLAVVLLLVAIAFGWTPWRGRRTRLAVLIVAIALLGAACVPAAPPGDGSMQPGIHSRAEWGARPFACAGGPEYAARLDFAVVHHTVNSNNYSQASVPQMMRSIQAYHMDANGYCDIAYNFIVDRFGGIWEARDGGISLPVIGGHTGGFNSGSVGVALLSDNTSVAPTGPQWSSLVSLLRWRLSIAGVNPKAPFGHVVAASPCNCMNWPAGTVVYPTVSLLTHRDLDQTSCPGDAMFSWMAELRDQVAAGYVPPPPPPPPAATDAPTTTTLEPTTTTTTLAPTTTSTT